MNALDDRIRWAADLLGQANAVAVLTGAGISAESGVPTFRGADGLWEGHRVEDVATPEAFQRDPVLVWRFYNLRRANMAVVKPNAGHTAIAELERRWGDRFGLSTQNIDGLHRVAGNERVYELHGSLARVRCSRGCGYLEDRGFGPLEDLPRCPGCGDLARPDVVWFGETLPEGEWESSVAAVHEADCVLVVGTSAVVYPAAGLIHLAARKDPPASIIEVNLEPSQAGELADVGLYGPAGEILPRLVELI